MCKKKQLRKMIKERIAALSEKELASRSKKIASAVAENDAFRSARSIFLYHSMKGEADTRALIDLALAQGKEVYLPRIAGEVMSLIPFRSGDPLQPNEYGIEEPTGDAVTATPDLVIIPLVAFDRDKRRLGRGKGYYDRFLSTFTGTSIALAFSEQEADKIPVEAFDRSVDIVITDQETIV